MPRWFPSKKREAQPGQDLGLEGSKRTAKDATELNKKDNIADIDVETVPKRGVTVLYEPSKPITAVVE